MSFDGEAAASLGIHWRHAGGGSDSLNAWESGNPPERFLEEGDLLFSLLILIESQTDLHRQHMIRVESGIDGNKPSEAFHHQSGSDE
jgi:hypothetical protein